MNDFIKYQLPPKTFTYMQTNENAFFFFLQKVVEQIPPVLSYQSFVLKKATRLSYGNQELYHIYSRNYQGSEKFYTSLNLTRTSRVYPSGTISVLFVPETFTIKNELEQTVIPLFNKIFLDGIEKITSKIERERTTQIKAVQSMLDNPNPYRGTYAPNVTNQILENLGEKKLSAEELEMIKHLPIVPIGSRSKTSSPKKAATKRRRQEDEEE